MLAIWVVRLRRAAWAWLALVRAMESTVMSSCWPLPLGLSEDAVYDELVFRLQASETLTLYTDGVLEARNAKGELYGLDRLAELLRGKPSVEEIVDVACNFAIANWFRAWCALSCR